MLVLSFSKGYTRLIVLLEMLFIMIPMFFRSAYPINQPSLLYYTFWQNEIKLGEIVIHIIELIDINNLMLFVY